MHPATRSTLTSTILLGVLLYAVLRFADGLMEDARTFEAAEQQKEGSTRGMQVREDTAVVTAAPVEEVDPYLPRIQSYDDLVTLLDRIGLNGLLVIEDTARWYAERGYLEENELLGVTPEGSRSAYYATLDAPTLRAMSDAGDAGATQTLARLAMFDDPIVALELYQKAVTQGSTYAAIKVADTLSVLMDLRGMAQRTNDGLGRRVGDLVSQTQSQDLNVEAYSAVVAAMADGGPPVMDAQLLDWSASLEDRIESLAVENACKRSADILIANSMARQINGVAPVSIKPPPVFLSPPDRDLRIPCSATRYPVVSMMNLEQCRTQRIVDATGNEQDLYICQP
ncbi:MAG: hypothetical protein ACN4GT_01120 [Gammaproteobacteria bacterium]